MCQSNVRKSGDQLAIDLPLGRCIVASAQWRRVEFRPTTDMDAKTCDNPSYHLSPLVTHFLLCFLLIVPIQLIRVTPFFSFSFFFSLPFLARLLATSIFSTSGPIIDKCMCVYTQTCIYYHVRASFRTLPVP